MGAGGEQRGGVQLLEELLAEVRANREELRQLRAELADRDVKPARGRRRRPPPPAPPELTETDKAAARAAARRLGLIVREGGR